MKEVKIIHLSDIHFCPEKKEEALASLWTAIEKGREEQIDLFALAGDLFDRALQNTAASGLPELQHVIQQMMDVAPVVAVKGTPTHDVKGCYEMLRQTKAEYGFTILDPHYGYYLINGTVYDDQLESDGMSTSLATSLLILGCPEPSKEWFLKDKRMGREEANTAIIEGIRSLLLRFGAVRKEHPDIPCLFLYHGFVEGATNCHGRDIIISRDDLALVCANYYALGHDHTAQQIGDLPAFYGGSVYPWDWGELEQKSFNSILISNKIVDDDDINSKIKTYSDKFFAYVGQVPFPHVPRKKIVCTLEEYDNTYWIDQLKDYQAWVVIRDREEAVAGLDPEYMAKSHEEMYGALPGSRVTIEEIPTETVRAGHIQEAKALAEKIQVWSENSGDGFFDDTVSRIGRAKRIIAKCEQLEREARSGGLVGEGLHIRYDKLSLRGATGILKGLGLDEIEIDFSQYDNGLIGLVGVCGTGKSTILKNLLAFPSMGGETGKLQDHFSLRDSWRDFYFTDERTGASYRSFIQVDGQNETGKCEYHLYRNGQSLTDGREKNYAEEIGRLFGSEELFLRSVYVAQKTSKRHPALSDATKGEKRAIFRELGGLDYEQACSVGAKGKADGLETSVLRDRGRADSLETLVAALPDKRIEAVNINGELITATGSLALAEVAGREAKHNKNGMEVKLGEQRLTQQKIEASQKQRDELAMEEHALNEEIYACGLACESKPYCKKQIAEYEDLKAKEYKLNAEKARILGRRELILAEYHNAQNIAHAAGRKIDSKKGDILQNKAAFCTEKALFLAEIANLIEKTEKPLDENCPTCGQILPEGKLDELRDERDCDIANLKQAQANEFAVEKEIAECDKQIAECNAEKAAIAEPLEPELPEFEEAKLADVLFGARNIDIKAARETIAQAQKAEAQIEQNTKRIESITIVVDTLKKELRELEGTIDPELEEKSDVANQTYEAVKTDYINAREQVKGLEVQHDSLVQHIVALEKSSEELQEIIQSIEGKQTEIVEWRYLEKGCGPDGIQALELDAMGPGIAAIATKLLGVACEYNPWRKLTRKGNAFDRVKFKTTRIGGAGSKRKQIEDFLIFAHDVRDDTWTEISRISGGESVWVIRAIYDAFGIVRDEHTGQRFLTVMQDEADGGLDPGSRLAYFRMLETAHEESGRRHTIVITHSQDAQDMIAQKIEMTELRAPEAGEMKA